MASPHFAASRRIRAAISGAFCVRRGQGACCFVAALSPLLGRSFSPNSFTCSCVTCVRCPVNAPAHQSVPANPAPGHSFEIEPPRSLQHGPSGSIPAGSVPKPHRLSTPLCGQVRNLGDQWCKFRDGDVDGSIVDASRSLKGAVARHCEAERDAASRGFAYASRHPGGSGKPALRYYERTRQARSRARRRWSLIASSRAEPESQIPRWSAERRASPYAQAVQACPRGMRGASQAPAGLRHRPRKGASQAPERLSALRPLHLA